MEYYRQRDMSKDELETLLLEINDFLNDEESLAASDKFLGAGRTKKMWQDRQLEATRQYIRLINLGIDNKRHQQRRAVSNWQDAYDTL